MRIQGIEGLTADEIEQEVADGGKFVIYQYCISVIIVTFKRPADPRFLKAGQNAVVPGLRWTGVSVLAGWWGFPWGPIHTIAALVTNFGGGTDVTREVMLALHQPPPPSPPPAPGPPVPVEPAQGATGNGDGELVGAAAEPAGWLPDPGGSNEYRYWDGSAWTDNVANGGESSIDAM